MVGITPLVTMAMSCAEPALQKLAVTTDIAKEAKSAKQEMPTLAILTANAKIASVAQMWTETIIA